MKNIELLPISRESKDRILKLAGMHKMYGGPSFHIGAVVGSHVLIMITSKGNDLGILDLEDRGKELFEDEMPGLKLYFAINTQYEKHIPTSDGRHVFRVDKGPFLALVSRDEGGAIEAAQHRYSAQIIDGDADGRLQTQLEKWVQMSILRDGVSYDRPGELDLRDARPYEEVLEDLFAQSPLPDAVRPYKSNYKKGKLGTAGIMRIIDDYTQYKCVIVCVPK